MSQGSFNIYQTNQDISIDPREIYAFGGFHSPKMRLKIDMSLRPAYANDNKNTLFVLTHVEAQITFEGFQAWTARSSQCLDIMVKKEGENNFYIEFDLDQNKISHIENSRKKDCKFRLNLKFQYAFVYPNIKNTERGTITQNLIGDIDIATANIHSEMAIPQSEWVSKFLPAFGWHASKLIELPTSSDLLPSEFDVSIKELAEAERFFNIGDYDKSVGHCRSALDPFKGRIKEVRQILQSETEREWAEDSLLASLEWIEKMYKRTQPLTSKPHHPPTYGHFDRQEAQIIFLVTTSLIAYIGKVFQTEK